MPEETIHPFFDVEKAVEEYGKRLFKLNGRMREQVRLRKRHFDDKIPCLDVQIDWSPLSVTHSTHWDKIANKDSNAAAAGGGAGDAPVNPATSLKPAETETHVLFKTDYENDTGEKQEYTLKIEKTTRSTCTTEISNGVTRGVELGATLNIADIMEVSAGYSREVSLTKTKGETIENEVTWGAESTITVPPRKSANAQMQVIEEKKSEEFTVCTTMQGSVRIKYYKAKNNKLVFSQTGKIKPIVEQYVKEVRETGGHFRGIKYNDDGSVTFETKGTCHFRYGIEQIVKVEQDKKDSP